MHGAARHDGVAQLLTLRRTADLYPELQGRYCLLDSASDSEAHGRYIRARGYLPIVAIRAPSHGCHHYLDEVVFTEHGVPLCAGGIPMRPHGQVHGRQRWICAGEVPGSGVEPHGPCHQPGCHTRSFLPKDSYRLIGGLHRGSRRFRKLFARRSAMERGLFKAMVADSKLEHGSRVQSRGRHHFDLFIEGLLAYGRAFRSITEPQTA